MTQLASDVVLQLSECDIYQTHTAVRHLHQMDHNGHGVTVVMPMKLRTHKGLTPWFASGVKVAPPPLNIDAGQVCALKLEAKSRHVHTAGAKPIKDHFASFDLRVGGLQVRALVDTGASCSCMTKSFAQRLGRAPCKRFQKENIGGIGGSIEVLGTLAAPVKLGKLQKQQTFNIVANPIANYDILLGEDFLLANTGSIQYSPTSVRLVIDDATHGKIILTRRLEVSWAAHRSQEEGVCALQIGDPPGGATLVSGKKTKALLRQIEAGKQVAYRVLVTTEASVGDQDDVPIPEGIQKVIDKHSAPGKTLCGKIPDHTHAKGFRCDIELVPGANPVSIRQYRLTPLEREELSKRVDEFIEKGWIEPSKGPWSSSVLFVPKPGGKLRFCVDFRGLNDRTISDAGTIPHQSELLDSLSGASLFSALDLASGFYQLALGENSKEVTAFPTPYGLYQWRVMPMGLKNAPAVFQRAMNAILKEHIARGYVLVYIDDIIILSKDEDSHAAHLDAVLTTLSEHNLFCQLPKCHWAKRQLKYLGHLVSGQGVLPDPAKVATLDAWEPPEGEIAVVNDPEKSSQAVSCARKRIVSECRRFLGFMNYFSRFIPRYAELAVDLHRQTSDNAPNWDDACTRAWQQMRQALRQATLMRHPDFAKAFHVYGDASLRAVGGALMQDIDGQMAPIAFCARKLTCAEVNYTTTEQECLALVYCFRQWRCYLEGSTTVLHTDHEPLTWLASVDRPSRRVARWIEWLSRFEYTVVYVKGDQNVVADALSRMLQPPEGGELGEALPGDTWPEVVMTLMCRSVPGGTGGPSETAPGMVESRLSQDTGAPDVRAGACVLCLHGAGFAVGHKPSYPYATPWRVLAGGYTRARASTSGRIRSSDPGSRSWAGEVREDRAGVNSRLERETNIGCDLWGPDLIQKNKDDRLIERDSRSRATGPSKRKRSGSKNSGLTQKRGRHDRYASDLAESDAVQQAEGNQGSPTPAHRRVQGEREGPVDSEEGDAHNGPGIEVSAGGDQDTHPSGSSAQGDVPERLPTLIGTGGNQAQGIAGADHPLLLGSGGADPPLSSLTANERLVSDLLERVRTACRTDSATRSQQDAEARGLVQDQGLWWRGNKLYIPDRESALVQDLLYWHHDVPWCAHLGIKKTVQMVKRQFWWKGMNRDIRRYVRSCIKCQANKPWRSTTRPPLTPLSPPDTAWKQLGVDLVVDLPKSTKGHNAICVFVCHLTKMVRLVPTHTTLDAAGFIRLFMREVFPHYGMPEAIVSDRGTQWNNELFQGMCRALGIQLRMSTAYHPQTNGLVERQNEVVSAALRHYVDAEHKDWDDFLPLIEFALNSSHHDALGCSPFSLNRIKVPKDPFQVLNGLERCRSQLGHSVGVSKLVGNPGARTAIQAEALYERARRSVQLAKDQMKAMHDRQALNLRQYQPGDLVWFNVRNIALRHPSLRHKLVPRYVGPIEVLEVIGRNAVRLQFPDSLHQIHPTVSISLIKPYHPRQGCPAPPVVIDGVEEWEVEQITGHNKLKSRRKNGLNVVEFRAQWKGDYEDSWHELRDFEHSIELVEHYLRNTCTRAERKSILELLRREDLELLSEDLRAVASHGRR